MVDESDGHVPGGKPEEISRLITLVFFLGHTFSIPRGMGDNAEERRGRKSGV